MWNRNEHISTNVHSYKNIKGVKIYSVLLYIYEALAIFPLFCDHQDTESESWDMDIGVAEPISIQKHIKVSMGQWYPYSTR